MFLLHKKYWSLISLLFMIAIVATVFFRPALAPAVSWIVIFISPVMMIAFAVQGDTEAYRRGDINRRELRFEVAFDVLGVVLSTLLVILVGAGVGKYVGVAVGKVSERTWPGMGTLIGIFSGLLSAILSGSFMSLLVHRTIKKMVHLRQPGRPRE